MKNRKKRERSIPMRTRSRCLTLHVAVQRGYLHQLNNDVKVVDVKVVDVEYFNKIVNYYTMCR